MRFILDINPETVEKIQILINKGEYRTVQDFISTAVQNQMYLTEESEAVSRSRPIALDVNPKGISEERAQLSSAYLERDLTEVPTLTPPDRGKVASELSYLWNKFLPVKITIRVLANMVKAKGESVPLEELQELASRTARQFGLMIVDREQKLDRRRGEKLSTALPVKPKRDENARMRFKAHFVGSLYREEIDGMPAALGLVDIYKSAEGEVLAGLTAEGLVFAKMENPVIDRNEISSSLSTEERQFLLALIQNKLPAEESNMKFILEAIRDGSKSSSELDGEIAHYKPDLKESQPLSFKAGLLSRLMDLQLVKRISNQTSSYYELTKAGMDFLREDGGRK